MNIEDICLAIELYKEEYEAVSKEMALLPRVYQMQYAKILNRLENNIEELLKKI